MTETFSIERRKLMRAFGAKVILTPAAERGSGMVRKAKELADKHGWFLARQFENEANPAYHRSTTGPEILRDFAGKRLDYFVSGWGTGGTITGAGEVLKLARPDLKIIASEPAGAALLSGKEWQPHKIQGWTPDFLPAVLSRTIADEVLPVDDVVARDTARRLAAEEGVFVGISAGATVAAALQVAGARARRFGAAGDAARHGRALPVHVPVRRRQRGLRRRVAGLAGGGRRRRGLGRPEKLQRCRFVLRRCSSKLHGIPLEAAATQIRAAHVQVQPAHQQVQAAREQVKAAHQQVQVAHEQVQAAHEQVKAAHAQVRAAREQVKVAHKQVQAACEQVKAATMAKKAATMQV